MVLHIIIIKNIFIAISQTIRSTKSYNTLKDSRMNNYDYEQILFYIVCTMYELMVDTLHKNDKLLKM